MRPVASAPVAKSWLATQRAMAQAVRAIASAEACDTTMRVARGAAPWCWEKPTSLRVVPERLEGYPFAIAGRPSRE